MAALSLVLQKEYKPPEFEQLEAQSQHLDAKFCLEIKTNPFMSNGISMPPSMISIGWTLKECLSLCRYTTPAGFTIHSIIRKSSSEADAYEIKRLFQLLNAPMRHWPIDSFKITGTYQDLEDIIAERLQNVSVLAKIVLDYLPKLSLME